MLMMGDSAMIADQRKASEIACHLEATPAGAVGVKVDLKSGENSFNICPISFCNQFTNTIGPVTYKQNGECMFQMGVSGGFYDSVNY